MQHVVWDWLLNQEKIAVRAITVLVKFGRSLWIRKHCICVKFADFDNCNLVLSETMFLDDHLWCFQGKRVIMSASHLQIGQKKCACMYICDKMSAPIWVKVRGVGNFFVLFCNF